jgi:kumamolisin
MSVGIFQQDGYMPERKVFSNSITPLPQETGLTPHGLMVQPEDQQHRNEKMTLLFSLAIRPSLEKELEEKMASGAVVSSEDLRSRYRSDSGGLDKLLAWLRQEGFEIVRVTQDGTGVYARATVAEIERTLSVRMVRVTKDGLTCTAAKDALSVMSRKWQ